MERLNTLKHEWFGNVRADILAGIVVALALIPEAIAFSLIGLDTPDPIPVLALDHQIAQKLHACTAINTKTAVVSKR